MKNKLPSRSQIRFILAEDARQEVLQKMSLQGLMPGEEFIVGGDPPPGVPSNIAFLIPSMAFVFVITGGAGKFNAKLRVLAPDKKTLLCQMIADRPIEKLANAPAVFVSMAKPFAGTGFGIYTAVLELDNAKFSFPIKVHKGPKIPSSK